MPRQFPKKREIRSRLKLCTKPAHLKHEPVALAEEHAIFRAIQWKSMFQKLLKQVRVGCKRGGIEVHGGDSARIWYPREVIGITTFLT